MNETPYSAYVTIRKKFLKSADHEVIEEGNVDKNNILNNQKLLENENNSLKQKVKDLEGLCEKLKSEYEELEVKYEESEKEKNLSEDKTTNLHIFLDKQKKCEEKLRMSVKESEENVMMLENVVKTRDLEITKLNEEMESFEANKSSEVDKLREELKKSYYENKFPCIFCEYKADNEDDLKIHIRRKHDYKCDRCDLAFESTKKIKDHICKINIRNPAHENCYMNNWILAKSCTPIYNKATKKEIVTLHYDDCWRKLSPCAELKPLNQVDSKDIFHCKVSRFVRNGFVNWPDMMIELH